MRKRTRARRRPRKNSEAPADPPELVNTLSVGWRVYSDVRSRFLPDERLDGTDRDYVTNILARLKPRDELEEMLLMQTIWTHARLASLSLLASHNPGHADAVYLHDACDGAAKTFRQQMQALIDYRNPGRAGDTFMAIKQANLAQQQVVQNVQEAETSGQPDAARENPAQRYRLSLSGLISLRESARRTKPWKQATGPKTPQGKSRSKMNAWKHGFRSSQSIAKQREARKLLSALRQKP